MRVWRCVHQRYLKEAWSGEGAKQFGGRWNAPGRRMVYASEHAALAVLEVMVGGVSPTDLADWRVVSAEVPAKAGQIAKGKDPRRSGEAFLDSGSLMVAVPSVVVPGSNLLLNPDAEGWEGVKVGKAKRLDPRLWG